MTGVTCRSIIHVRVLMMQEVQYKCTLKSFNLATSQSEVHDLGNIVCELTNKIISRK